HRGKMLPDGSNETITLESSPTILHVAKRSPCSGRLGVPSRQQDPRRKEWLIDRPWYGARLRLPQRETIGWGSRTPPARARRTTEIRAKERRDFRATARMRCVSSGRSVALPA